MCIARAKETDELKAFILNGAPKLKSSINALTHTRTDSPLHTLTVTSTTQSHILTHTQTNQPTHTYKLIAAHT